MSRPEDLPPRLLDEFGRARVSLKFLRMTNRQLAEAQQELARHAKPSQDEVLRLANVEICRRFSLLATRFPYEVPTS
jgi:hypothetical protein